MTMAMRAWSALLLAGSMTGGMPVAGAQESRPPGGPVIDMHLHAFDMDEVPPGIPACPGDQTVLVPTVDPRDELDFSAPPTCERPIFAASGDADLRDKTLAHWVAENRLAEMQATEQFKTGEGSHYDFSAPAVEREVSLNRDRLADILEVEATTISEGSSFSEDLEADSLALIELVEAIEEELGERTVGFRIDDEDLEDLKTVRDAVDYVCARL